MQAFTEEYGNPKAFLTSLITGLLQELQLRYKKCIYIYIYIYIEARKVLVKIQQTFYLITWRKTTFDTPHLKTKHFVSSRNRANVSPVSIRVVEWPSYDSAYTLKWPHCQRGCLGGVGIITPEY